MENGLTHMASRTEEEKVSLYKERDALLFLVTSMTKQKRPEYSGIQAFHHDLLR